MCYAMANPLKPSQQKGTEQEIYTKYPLSNWYIEACNHTQQIMNTENNYNIKYGRICAFNLIFLHMHDLVDSNK
jgi:hypothetical protein